MRLLLIMMFPTISIVGIILSIRRGEMIVVPKRVVQ